MTSVGKGVYNKKEARGGNENVNEKMTTSEKINILVLMTGGTICSSKGENGENQSNAKRAKAKIIDGYYASKSPVKDSVNFEVISLTEDVLSENITLSTWEELLKILSQERAWTGYRGVIILHGTDTLAYTASLLALSLSGLPMPVILVSAGLDLDNEHTNGFVNFRVAVELIVNGIAPNVYATYKNATTDGVDDEYAGDLLVHYGSNLLQCGNYSSNFYSKNAIKVTNEQNAKLAGKPFASSRFYAKKIERLSEGVICIQPYIGLDYSKIDLDGVKAILHGAYHSGTVCVGRKTQNDRDDNYDRFSILYLLEKCKERGIDVFITPCDEKSYAYASTGDALRHGGVGVYGMTNETAYIKLLLGVSLGKSGKELADFMKSNVNGELIY